MELIKKNLTCILLHSFISVVMGPCTLQEGYNVIPMSGEAGRLSLPRHPRDMPSRNITCTWIITVPEGYFVKLRLTSIELGEVCKNSTLSVRDGQNVSSPLVESFCTNHIGRSIFSRSRYLWVRFQSPKEDWNDDLWFTAEFEAVKQCKTSNNDCKN